jgi:hypothetical protein
VSDIEDAAAALGEVVLLDGDSPQADALGKAVAEHVNARVIDAYQRPTDAQVEAWFDSLDKLHARGIALPIDRHVVNRMRDEHNARKERTDD